MLCRLGPPKNTEPTFIFLKLLRAHHHQTTRTQCRHLQFHAYRKAFTHAAKNKLNLVDAVLARLVKYSTYTDIVQFMGEFSVSPERVIKMAARESRTFLIEMISKAAWEITHRR